MSYLEERLRKEWGADPPSVDLYVRAGCKGAFELDYMFQGLELFWPSFLGEVVVALDAEDDPSALLPKETKHTIRVVKEHSPCMSGRVFNQYSYLTLDRHVRSEYVVTLDSDVVLFRPFTRDALFDDDGNVVFLSSDTFQRGLWEAPQLYFTHVRITGTYGQAMVTQPVAIRTDTTRAYRDWVKQKFPGYCGYEERLSDFVATEHPVTWFCWMCQLGAFIGSTNATGYRFVRVDSPDDGGVVFVRYGFHVPYEYPMDMRNKPPPQRYHDAVEAVVNQGLCLFVPGAFPPCDKTNYVRELAFSYGHRVLFDKVNPKRRHRTLMSVIRKMSQHR